MNKPKKKRKRPKVWTIERSEYSIGKPTHLFVLEIVPGSYDDVVHNENYTKGFVSKNELFFEFVDDQLRGFFRDELPEGCLFRGRVQTFIKGIHDVVKKDVISKGSNKGNDSGSGRSPDEEVRTPS